MGGKSKCGLIAFFLENFGRLYILTYFQIKKGRNDNFWTWLKQTGNSGMATFYPKTHDIQMRGNILALHLHMVNLAGSSPGMETLGFLTPC